MFSVGCGRLFEGTPQQMMDSLEKLKTLPNETLVYCAHEYTEHNCEFALTIDPENSDLKNLYVHVKELRAKNQSTIPSTIGLECKTNPFLRPNHSNIRDHLDMENNPVIDVFTEIRRRKDNF